MKAKMQTLKAVKPLTVAALIAAGFAASSTNAAPLVTNWNYSTDATFIAATYETGGSGTTTTSAYELSWGAMGADFQNPNSDRSALTVGSGDTGNARIGGGPVTGSIATTIGPVPLVTANGISLTHWNNPISASYNTLLTGSLRDTLTLTPTAWDPAGDPDPGAVNAPTITFNFDFRETPNAGPCAGGTTTPCGDLFGFAGLPNLNQAFVLAGITYYAQVFVLGPGGAASPIAFLNDGQCAALGFGSAPLSSTTTSNICQGFLTAEGQATTAQFAFAVTTEPISVSVPEPGTLALLGLGLLGAGASLRRRKAV